MEYDFDYLKDLYVSDPEEFKRVTDTMISDLIESVPKHRGEIMARKQWRLEHKLRHIKDPIERMNKMVNIFWQGVLEFNEVLDIQSTPTKKDSTVINFTKKDHGDENER